MLAAEATKLLIVGISDYDRSSLNLDFPRFNAKELRLALLKEEGCAIPEKNISALHDVNASRVNILRSLENLAKSCQADDILIFYFSGHGEQSNQTLYLLGYDAREDDLPNSAISTSDLQGALTDCIARGILVILDCCKSAGFAEHADQFFRTLANQEFRLMLSASRAGQLSYEFSQSRGTLFSRALVDVISGRIATAGVSGLIYFFDLLSAIQKQVAEGLEALGHDASSQEPVFAGTSAKDPLIFVLKRQSLERVEADAPSYSRRFVRRRMRRALTLIASLFATMLAAYYYYLDHSRYIWYEPGVVAGYEGDYLAIYTGDSRLNWLGFPHRVFTTDIRADALFNGRPGIGLPIQVHFSNDIVKLLRERLSVNWKIAVDIWNSQTEQVWKDAQSINVYDTPDESGQKEAIEGLASVANRSNLSQLTDLISADATSSSPAALRTVASLDANGAINVLEDEELEDLKFSQAILNGLTDSCDADVNKFISTLATHSFDDTYMHDAWFGAVIRTKCTLTSARMLEIIDKSSTPFLNRALDWLPVLITDKPGDFDAQMRSNLEKSINTSPEANNSDASYRLSLGVWAKLRISAILSPVAVPDSAIDLLSSPFKHVRLAAARALLAKDTKYKAVLSRTYAKDPWILSALVESGWYDEAVIRSSLIPLEDRSKLASGSYFSASVMFFFRTLRLHHVEQAERLLMDVLPHLHSPEVKIEALRTIQGLVSAKNVDRDVTAVITGLEIHDIQSIESIRYSLLHGTYEWFVRNNATLLQSVLKSSIYDTDDVARILGRSKLTREALDVFRRKLRNQNEQLSAATLLAMRGTDADLHSLLSSPNCSIRRQAMLYAAYNPSVETILKKNDFTEFGSQVRWYLAKQMNLRTALGKQINAAPMAVRGLTLTIVREQWPDISPGLWMWIDDQIDSVEGQSIDGPEEINLDNSPPPLNLKSP